MHCRRDGREWINSQSACEVMMVGLEFWIGAESTQALWWGASAADRVWPLAARRPGN
jgi:hypothetical protein